MAGVTDWVERVPHRSQLDPRVLESACVGQILKPLLGAARIAEGVGRRMVARVFRRFDVVLAPTTAQPPLPIGACEGLGSWETDKAIVAACPYAWPWNVLGWPAVNVPAGFTDAGLPIGVQLLGAANSEPRLLALAAQLEDAERWFEHSPAPVTDFARNKGKENTGTEQRRDGSPEPA
jgi:amidase